MKISSLLNKASLRVLCMLPLALFLHAGTASAQQSERASAASTLDVCHDNATGNWRYFGVVATDRIRPGHAIAVDNIIQNKVSDAGFADVYKQASILGDSVQVQAFSIEAAPLVLGTVRHTARLRIIDLANPGAVAPTLVSAYHFETAVCGCGHPMGCTRTQGYWGNKPGVVWPVPYTRNAMFYSSGLTWQQVRDTPPKQGNAYLILAHQFIAAVLNRAAGASAPSAVQNTINQAAAFFASGTTLQSCANDACGTQKSWAAILDTYNNGLYPGAPAACPG